MNEQEQDALGRLVEADDATITGAISALHDVLVMRARQRGDLNALIELGFERGFSARGVARPWIESGVLICPGLLIEKSGQSHDCTFVSVGGEWVWRSDDVVGDEMRRSVTNGKTQQLSVSLVALVEGMELNVVSSQKRQGTHKMAKVESYVVRDGALVPVASRTVSTGEHRD